jgi:serine/threonine-protein kinase
MTDPITRLNAALTGRYRIERELGEGGMATVYLAEDLKHDRNVALKVLKPELAAVVGADRFLAEIKTTANLQHPHILPLFDSGAADSFLFYVMPYVEGESVRERLDREHQLPVDEAVQIARDVGEALQAAHERGVIHRDIKPANILLSKGRPLVSDFGIALAVGVAGASRLTETGLSLGTPHYMSPEQATGDSHVGAATDIYALGCVLYEMLVGEPPYTGSTPQAILGKIIQAKPVSATESRRTVPPHVDAAIRKALEKLPADRFLHAQDFVRALADAGFRHGEAGAQAGAAGTRLWVRLSAGLAATTVLFALGLGWALLRPQPVGQVARFSSPFETGQAPVLNSYIELTADGSTLVYAGPSGIMLRRWEALEAVAVPGGEGGIRPVLSPDEREVAFVVGRTLRVAPLDGGPARTVAEGVASATEWTDDGRVYFTRVQDFTLARTSAAGGDTVEDVTEVQEGEFFHAGFRVLPGSRFGVFQVAKDVTGEGSEIWAIDLETGERRFLRAGLSPRYSASGHLLFGTADGLLMAQRIDPATAELAGTAIPVAEALVLNVNGAAEYAVSANGTLIYRAAGEAGAVAGGFEPVWVSRSGEATSIDPNWRANVSQTGSGLRISPDGRSVAVMRNVDGNDDIWIMRLPDGPFERLTSDELPESSPSWSPDGQMVTYERIGSGLWQSRADGTGSPRLLLAYDGAYQARTSPNGEWIVFRTVSGPGADPTEDILGFRPGVDTVAVPLFASAEFSEQSPTFSPDGRWLAYTSNRSGTREVYVSPFPDVESARVTVSRNGGLGPQWSHSGRELFYVDGERRLVAAEVEADAEFRVLSIRTLFPVRSAFFNSAATDFYDVAPDDQRFLMMRAAGGAGGNTRHVLVQGFFAELERLEAASSGR